MRTKGDAASAPVPDTRNFKVGDVVEVRFGGDITIACDNGMISAWFTWALSKLAKVYGVHVSIIPLAAYHAYSLCDGHGGQWRCLLFRKPR